MPSETKLPCTKNNWSEPLVEILGPVPPFNVTVNSDFLSAEITLDSIIFIERAVVKSLLIAITEPAGILEVPLYVISKT